MRLIVVVLCFLVSATYSYSQESKFVNDSLIFYYKTGQYIMTADQILELKTYLSNKNLYRARIEGYADYVGETRDNNVLALNRAKHLLEVILNEQLIDSAQISSKGEQIKPEKFNEYEGRSEDRKSICYVTYSNILVQAEASRLTKNVLDSTSVNYLESINLLNVGEGIILNNILFYLGEAVIIPSSFPELQALKEILLKNPNLVIEIRGHVCCGVIPETIEDLPTPKQSDFNMELSRYRASAIKNYLVGNAVDADRVNIKGMGFLEPLFYPEKNEKQRQLNRRIELIVLKK